VARFISSWKVKPKSKKMGPLTRIKLRGLKADLCGFVAPDDRSPPKKTSYEDEGAECESALESAGS
jgi:hypothetical protein